MKFLLPILVSATLLGGCRNQADDNVDAVAKAVRARDFEQLKSWLTSEDKDLRCRAANALVWARGADAQPHLVEMLAYEDCGWPVRAEAGWRLMEDDHKPAVPLIAALLKDDVEQIRWNAAKMLGEYGHKEALSEIESCRSDKDKFVAAWCVWAHCKLTTEDECDEPNMSLVNGEPAP